MPQAWKLRESCGKVMCSQVCVIMSTKWGIVIPQSGATKRLWDQISQKENGIKSDIISSRKKHGTRQEVKSTTSRNHKVDGTHPNRMLSCLYNFITCQYNTFNIFMYSLTNPGRGASGACTPTAKGFLNFMQFLGNFGKNVCLPGALAPTPKGNPRSGSVIYSRIEYTNFSQVRQSLQFCEILILKFSKMIQQQRHLPPWGSWTSNKLVISLALYLLSYSDFW